MYLIIILSERNTTKSTQTHTDPQLCRLQGWTLITSNSSILVNISGWVMRLLKLGFQVVFHFFESKEKSGGSRSLIKCWMAVEFTVK